MHKIKILLVDDHDILMDGIAAILDDEPKLKVIGKASSVSIARELVNDLVPDLVLTDISMGDLSGLELTEYCMRHFPDVKVIVLSMHDSVHYVSSLFEAGALGYLLKNVKREELLLAIESVMEGRQYIQQSLAGGYMRAIKRKELAENKCPLSRREIEIVR